MTKAYLMTRPNSKLPILFPEDAIGDAHETMICEGVFEMYDDDIEKVNDFFIALDRLCQADDHLSPYNREAFAKVIGKAVRWNFSANNLCKAGLFTPEGWTRIFPKGENEA